MRAAVKILTASALALTLAGGVFAGAPSAEAASVCVIPGRSANYQQIKIPARQADFSENVAEYEEPKQVKTFVIIEKTYIGILPEPEEEAPAYSTEDLEMLACVIYQEAGGDTCTDETRRMVGEVVLNRVADPRFPNTIEEVLLQKRQYGRMHWTGIVWLDRAKNEPEAVERAYKCAEAVFTEERLLPEDVVWQAEFPQGKECVVHTEGFYFCR